MKYLFTPLCVVLLFAVFVFGFQPYARAEDQVSIAVVDVERALNEADSAKALNKKRAQARETFLTKLSKEEAALRDEGKALFGKRKDLGEEEFAKQQRIYQEKLVAMSKLTQKNRRAFEQASSVAVKALQDELANVVQEIAADKKYSLVISNRYVITGDKSLDITDFAISKMNAKKTTIPFNVKN